jgi:hypothetical protein
MSPKHRKALTAAGAVVAAGVVAATLLQPSGSVTVKPGDDVGKASKSLKSGGVLTFAPGTYHALTLDGLQNETLNCAGAVLALKLSNFRNVTVNGGEFTGGTYGLMAVDGSGLTLNAPYAHDNQMTGILTGAVDAVTITGGESSHNLKEHGVYISRRCKTARISLITLRNNGKSGFQANCDEGGGSDISIDRLTCDGNQRVGGAAAIQLAYVNGGSVTDCVISNHRGRAGIALFWHTKKVTIDRNQFGFVPGLGKANVSIDKSSDGTIGPLNRAAAGVPLCVRE